MRNRLGIEEVLINLKHINEMSHQNVFIIILFYVVRSSSHFCTRENFAQTHESLSLCPVFVPRLTSLVFV